MVTSRLRTNYILIYNFIIINGVNMSKKLCIFLVLGFSLGSFSAHVAEYQTNDLKHVLLKIDLIPIDCSNESIFAAELSTIINNKTSLDYVFNKLNTYSFKHQPKQVGILARVVKNMAIFMTA